MSPFLDFILTVIPLGITFLLGCVGETLTEKVGHLNLGIPGIMCIGGAAGCLTLSFMHGTKMPPFLIVTIAILASFIAGALMGGLYSLLTVTLKANQNVTGLAMTTFGAGINKLIMLDMATPIKSIEFLYALPYFRFPFDERTNALKYWGVLLYLALAIAVVAAFVLQRTKLGLHLRAVGESPATADAAGINVTAYKYGATCVGSGIAALGGLFYIMDYAGSIGAYKQIEALGWLSVALVIFTLWKPLLSIAGSILFGMLYLIGTYLPTFLGIRFDLSVGKLFELLPYVITILVLIISSVRKKRENQPPAGLGIPYFREER